MASYCPPALAKGLTDQHHSKLACRIARRVHFEREKLEQLYDSMSLTQLEMPL